MGEWKLAPVEPTGDMMDAVRHLFQWLAFARPTEQELLRHCERRRIEPPAECRDVDHVPPKRMMAYWVYKGMLAASPAPSLPEDVAASAAFLNEAARYFENCPAKGEDRAFWAAIHNAENCRKAAALIQSLSSQLAEAQAEVVAADADRSAARAGQGLAVKRGNIAEADRDRLAAENASRDRLIYHLVSWIENEAGAELPLDEDQFNLACSIRAALASLEERG